MKNVINLKGITKSFEDQEVLKDLDLEAKQKEILAIIGQSGAGKTTLLRIIAGLEKPDEGIVDVNGDIGLVFQHGHLWPHKTVIDNIKEPLIKVKKIDKKLAEQKAEQILEKLGLLNKSNCFPETLSGGETQRAAIARTLATEPDILLLDEITANLDPKNINEIQEILRKISKEKTLVIVTHDMNFAKEISDKIAILKDQKIIDVGHPYTILRNYNI